MKSHQLFVNRSRNAPKERANKTQLEKQSGKEVRLLAHLKYATQQSPERMTADVVGFLAVMKPHHERTVIPCSEFAMMKRDLLRKRARLPSIHPSRRYRDPVDRSAFDRLISADGVETAAAKKLTRTGNVFELRELVRVGVLVPLNVIFEEGRASDT
jgi:hypothetical protein